jgi:restriction system protein
MLRAGRGGESAEEFIAKGLVAMGWNRLGDLTAGTAKDKLLHLVGEKYPEAKPATRGVWASQMQRFVNELHEGDTIVTY